MKNMFMLFCLFAASKESGVALRTFLHTPAPYWTKFLFPWVRDFYPVLGWGLAAEGKRNSCTG